MPKHAKRPETVSLDAVPDSPAPESFVIESGMRLSRSILWAAQRRYFINQGIGAWRDTTVPHYITNNPRLARAYAEIALGHLRDCIATGIRFDASSPLTILELGTGSGRFGFLLLRAFSELLQASPFAGTPFRLILTDLARANLDFWLKHPRLRGFLEEGRLDAALFDLTADHQLTLVRSGEVLGPGSLAAPPIVIANYVFDSVPQDAFALRDGVVLERLASVSADRPELDLDDPGCIAGLSASFTDRPLDGDAYEEAEFNAMLAAQTEKLGDGVLMFPSVALRCIDRLARLADGRLLLLSGDRGTTEALDDAANLGIAVHGSFSLPVDYRLLVDYVEACGGAALSAGWIEAGLVIVALRLGGDAAATSETRLAFDRAIVQGGPNAVFALRRGIQSRYAEFDLVTLLAALRVTGWDPKVLTDCVPALWERVETASPSQCAELADIVHRTWANYYWIGEAHDVAFDYATLLFAVNDYAAALDLFEESLTLYGNDARNFWNMGLCLAALGDPEQATRYIAAALATEPGLPRLAGLLMKLPPV